MAIFSKINFGLSKTRNKMAGAIDDMLDNFDSFEEDLYTELEEILVMSDVGVQTAVTVVEELKQRVKSEKIKKTSEVKKELQNIIADLLYGGEDMGLITMPSVILVIGVNGAGKTTTIGKMAAMYKAEGKKVILGAADTFRAAAIDQLDVWANRAGVEIIKHPEGADPAAVVYDTIKAGIARDCDIIIIDTAGRLHNKKNLMDELNKIYRVTDKELPYADREVLLVLDATTGQNAVNQAREFAAVAELTGIVLTKLDGTARGGVVLSIKNELKLPVKFIGVGEGIDDLQPFDPAAFAKSLFIESDKKEEDKDGNSLDELINSEDYKNYKPDEENGSDSEEVRQFLEEAFAVFGNADDSEREGDGTENEGTDGEDGIYERQENTVTAEEETEETEESAQKTTEVPEETSNDDQTEADGTADEEPETRIETEKYVEEEPEIPEITEPEEIIISEEIPETPAEELKAEEADTEPKEENNGKKRRGLFGFFNRHS